MATDQVSATQTIEGISCYAVQYSWSAFSGDGTEIISTLGSNDGEIWTSVDAFIPSGTTGNRLLNVEKAGYAFVSIEYTAGSTSGTLLVTISGKVI